MEGELKKVQVISQAYYARKDIQQAMFDFCKNRETVPNFNMEYFGKRPDALDYPSDIFNSAKNGATSFHCSEELWQNPLEISKDMTPGQLNELKIGWDFLIDIDSKYLDYSKIAAKLIIQVLEYNGLKNMGIKFSGSKGFHLIVPWKAFPKELNGAKTKDMFPEWPRAIAGYIFELIKEPMNKEIMNLTSREDLEKTGELISAHICPKCGNPAEAKEITIYKCPNFKCRSEVTSMTGTKKKKLRCPSCNGNLEKISVEEIYFCPSCKINTKKIEGEVSTYGGRKVKKSMGFKKEETTLSQINSVDIVLVSPRHLFRAPYSLHEKTSLASIVLDKKKIDSFSPTDADPLKVKPLPFDPECGDGEAKELLLNALGWAEKEEKPKKKWEGTSIDVKDLKITEDMFPDCIKKLLLGVKQDGRKRALSLLLSFFSSLEFPQEYIETSIEKWNKKNYAPLKVGYIKSQISWYIKNPRMPPNYNRPIYRELGILGETHGLKNPINHTIKAALRKKGKTKK